MRAPWLPLLWALALLAPALAGCITNEPLAAGAIDAATLDVAAIDIPDGAELVQEDGAVILRFLGVDSPFERDIVIPAGVTIVRTVAKGAVGSDVSATMKHAETERRRCNTDFVDAWDLDVTGTSTCSGVAAIDPPGSTWTMRATGPAAGLDVDIVFETAPLDGIAGMLDISRLSMPVFNTTATEYLQVPSFDGTLLWTEVTVPEGDGPWPTILAASPYNGWEGRGTDPAMWAYFAHDWVKRGYAVVNVDVRGFGMSGGCIEVWGENEQRDQAFMVDWVADQPWSDGAIGFYGQSYVATTPVAAAVQAPEALKAIIAVAPVISAYDDWHYGGVPNGENTGSPRYYQGSTDPKPYFTTDPAQLAEFNTKGYCDATLTVRANDPRAVYDAFYEERNFSKRAADVTAAVLYTQGFEDRNVKSAMIPHWFNAITAPKLGLFGHWVHQHPTRADQELLFIAWMDQYVKGRDLGFDAVPAVEVVTADSKQVRRADSWPPADLTYTTHYADFGTGTLGPEGKGSTILLLSPPTRVPSEVPSPTTIVLTLDVPEAMAFAGSALLDIEAVLENGGNAFVDARLFDVAADGTSALITYGQFNLAHRYGHDRFETVGVGETVRFMLPFLPTEHVVEAGHTLSIELRGVPTMATGPGYAAQPGVLSMTGATTSLLLPAVDVVTYSPAPRTSTP